MSFANFGIGLNAALGAGLKTYQLGQAIKQGIKDGEIDDARTAGMDEAKANRASEVAGKVGIDFTGDGTGADSRQVYKVGDQTFDSESDARGAADKSVAPLSAFVSKSVIPKMAEAYIAQGRVEEADKLTKWADDAQVKEGFGNFMGGVRSLQAGDTDAALGHFTKAYNNEKYFPDGMEITGSKKLTNEAGDFTGLTLTMKNKKTGKTSEQTLDGGNILNAAAGFLSPPQAFEYMRKQADAQTSASADLAKENRSFKRDLYRDGIKDDRADKRDERQHGNKLEELATKAQLDAAMKTTEFQKKAAYLKEQGYDDAFIKSSAPAIVGIKDGDTQELRRKMFASRMNSDMKFPRMTPEQQQALIDSDLQVLGGGQAQAPAATPGASPAQPAQAGKTPVLDTKTGQIVYR